MHISSQNGKTIGAAIIAAAMVGIALWLTSPSTRFASALSTDELLRAYIEQDTDADGLPDWQEKVYGTDPADPESVEAGLTDLEAVAQGLVKPAFTSEVLPKELTQPVIPGTDPAPQSLTERFSVQFIEAYFAAGGGKNVSDEEQTRILNDLITTFSSEAIALIDSSYSSVSLRMSRDVEPLSYIGSVEQLLVASLPKENSDMPAIAGILIETGDTRAGDRLKELSKIYGGIAQALLQVPVPPELVEEHLLLLRSYDRVGRAGLVLANYESDPIAALGALSAFVPAREDVVTAFTGFAAAVLSEGEPLEGEPGDISVNFVRAEEQK